MNHHEISVENFLSQFPYVLAQVKNIYALARTIAEFLRLHLSEIPRVNLYTNIKEITESLLEILAYDFKIDWWNPDYSFDEKQNIFKDSWKVHRTIGTKFALETALSDIFPHTKVEEWFEYGGEPYHFRIRINAAEKDMNPELYQQMIPLVDRYKNLRSHLDGIFYNYPETAQTTTIYSGTGILFQTCHKVRANMALYSKQGIPSPEIYAGVGLKIKLLNRFLLPYAGAFQHTAQSAQIHIGSGIFIRIHTSVRTGFSGFLWRDMQQFQWSYPQYSNATWGQFFKPKE